MTSQAVMKRYLTSVAKNNEEYKDNKSMQTLASLIANYKNLDAEDKEVLDAKIESAYNKLQAKGVSASKSTSKATTTRRTKSSSDGGLKTILAELKKKLGAEKFKDATRGTDIKKDIQIPALKKGKRIVRKKGYTTNQYGKFKNKIGTAYWESRANRYDANQPSQTRKYKLADGGEVEKIQVGDYVIVKNNPYWEGGLGSEKSYRRKVKMISGEGKDKDFFFTDGSNSSSKYVHSIKKHAKGGELEEKGNLNRWSNSGLDEIIKRHEVITEQVRFAFAKVLGLDRAYALLLNDNVGVSPYSLVERAVSSDLLLIDEIDKNLINSAIEQSEDSRRYSESGEGIGSSDITYMLKYMLDGAGLKTDFVKNTLQRVDNNGNVIQLKNKLPKTTMFAEGGEMDWKAPKDLQNHNYKLWFVKGITKSGDAFSKSFVLHPKSNEDDAMSYIYEVIRDIKKITEIHFELKKFAKGGIIEHGLKTGDRIVSGKIIGTTIRVRNESLDEDAKVDLNTGNRTLITYDKKSKKWVEKMAQGGKTSEVNYNDILPILKEKLEDSIDNLPRDYEYSSEYKGEEVESKSRDGFIAFTDGGYEVTWFEYISYFSGSGNSLPTKALDNEMQRQIDQNYEYAKDRFKDEYSEIVEELGEENIDYNSLYEAGYESEAEQLSEWESDYDGSGTIMCEIGAYYYNPSNSRGIEGEHTIRLFGLVNLESPYHRSGNLEDRFDVDITFSSIAEMEEKIDKGLSQIIEWFNGANYNESTEKLRIVRMAKGGKLSSKAKYIPKRDIAEIEVEKNGKSKSIDGANLLDGVYVKKGTKFAKGGKTSEEYAVSGILSENDKIEIISKHKSFASALTKMNKMWDEGKLDKYLEVRVRPISKSMEYAKGGDVKSKRENYNHLVMMLKKNESALERSQGTEMVEKTQQEIQRIKDILRNEYGEKFAQGGTTKRIKRRSC